MPFFKVTESEIVMGNFTKVINLFHHSHKNIFLMIMIPSSNKFAVHKIVCSQSVSRRCFHKRRTIAVEGKNG